MERVCDGGYAYVGNRGIYSTRSNDVESSLVQPILNGKIWTVNDNNDDDEVRPPKFLIVCNPEMGIGKHWAGIK